MKHLSDDYANQMKHVLNSIVDDKAKEESSIKISKELFGSNKNRKRPLPRNQDEEENQKSDDEDEDEDSKSKKKKPKKTYATDLVNVYQIEVVPKSSGKDESHNKLHMCTLCTDTNFTNFAKHLIDMHPEEDEVLFIRQHPKTSVFRGYHAMKKSVAQCPGLNKPHLLCATRMRKLMACVTQVRF